MDFHTTNTSIGIIVGSAFNQDMLRGLSVSPLKIDTPYGPWTLYEVGLRERRAFISFRHGFPHTYLPNQIPYRAQTWAFRNINCGALLVTSSVGILDPVLPLFQPLLVSDILTLDNRLPDGSACTMFTVPSPEHGHLVLKEGLISPALTRQLHSILSPHYSEIPTGIIFGYVGGPRTKTKAENRMWQRLGAQVNSMTVAPEVILANEFEIPCCVAVVGHKYSLPDSLSEQQDDDTLTDSFESSRNALGRIVRGFIAEVTPVSYGNELYRYAEAATS